MNKLMFDCKLIGEDYSFVKDYTQGGKRKIALYANCLLVPVILWFINGYLLIMNVLEGTMFTALLTASISASIIFLIERAIVMSNGSKPIFWFRIILGFVVASLGSISMDEVIFKHDIDNQVADYRQSEVDVASKKVESVYKNQIAMQQTIVNKKYVDWQKRLDDVNSEMKGGKNSSGYRGKGVIAIENIRMAALLQSDYEIEKNKLSLLMSSAEKAKAQAKEKAEAEFKGNALLVRIRAMFDLIAKDKVMLGVYTLFTLFLFCLEFLVVLIKVGSKYSIDEELEKAREQLLRAKTKKTLDRNEILFQPELHTQVVQNANILIQKKPSSIFN